MYVCMYACVCMYVCMYVCMCVYVCMYVCVCMLVATTVKFEWRRKIQFYIKVNNT